MTRNSGFGKSSTARNMVKSRSKMRLAPKAAAKRPRAGAAARAVGGERTRAK